MLKFTCTNWQKLAPGLAGLCALGYSQHGTKLIQIRLYSWNRKEKGHSGRTTWHCRLRIMNGWQARFSASSPATPIPSPAYLSLSPFSGSSSVYWMIILQSRMLFSSEINTSKIILWNNLLSSFPAHSGSCWASWVSVYEGRGIEHPLPQLPPLHHPWHLQCVAAQLWLARFMFYTSQVS